MLAQGGMIKPLKNHKGRIEALELYNRDGWRIPMMEMLLFRKLKRKKAIASQGGEPYRIFYAFDPRRAAILLIGGCKTGDDRFYETMIPVADDLYDVHLEEIRKEGFQ